ncbi:MAG: aminoglycoside phosphotransferase family protein [Patescibacteria group bacterium]|jgi:aminoglycoside phosphotransferase (APT) family kinase protein
MNKILQLFDEEFVLTYFKEQVLPLYSQYTDIGQVKIKPYKKLIWTTTYHVVISFQVWFKKESGDRELVQIVCSAHSNEPRENVYQVLTYLTEQNFNNQAVSIPRPLFYSSEFNATFYQALVGENLLYYIKGNQREEIVKVVVATAQLFARLHSLPAIKAPNFNPDSARIRTVVPGVENILREMSLRFNRQYSDELEKFYHYFITEEESYLSQTKDLCLIHGDAHPENIIKTGENSIGVIDLTDICQGDYARDLGTFLQQLEYKILVKIGSQEFADEMKKLFLDNYFLASGQSDSPALQKRIQLYYDWTAIRTATYLFLKHDPNETQGEKLFNKVKEDLIIDSHEK